MSIVILGNAKAGIRKKGRNAIPYIAVSLGSESFLITLKYKGHIVGDESAKVMHVIYRSS